MRASLPLLVVAAVMAAPAPVAHAQGKAGSEAEITFNLGLTHLREGRLEEAIEAFKKAIKQDGKNPYIYKGLGVAYAQYADKCPATDTRCRTSSSTNTTSTRATTWGPGCCSEASARKARKS
jgi:Flp pilus assembly protein TadD